MASVLGTGPVAITTDNATHLTVPLSALSYDGSVVAIAGWPPAGSPPDALSKAKDWVAYLFNENELQAYTPVGKAPLGPAFLVEASHPGTSGNTIQLVISAVVPLNPPNMTTCDIAVTAVDVYTGLTLATLADVIGTTEDGGTMPGLIHLASAAGSMPKAQKVPFSTVAPAQAKLAATSGDAFTLEAPGDGGGATQFDVEVTNATATQFDLTVTWKKAGTGKTLAEHATAFAYLLKITAPPGGYGVPVAGTYTLHGGTNPSSTPAPASPATETIPSA